MKTYRLPNQKVLPFLQPYIALQAVESYYQRVIGSGDYYNLYHEEKIDNLNHLAIYYLDHIEQFYYF